MMRLLTAFIGLIVGVLAGVIAVLINPFAKNGDAAPITGDTVMTADFIVPEYRGMNIAPGTFLSGRAPRERAAFSDPALQYGRVGIVLLDGSESMPPALAIRLTALAKDNALLTGRLATTSTWNVFWPGEGSVFLLGNENYWPLFSADALEAMLGGDARQEETMLPLSSVSGRRGSQVVLGAGGRHDGARGHFEETARFRPGDTDPAGGELRIRLNAN